MKKITQFLMLLMLGITITWLIVFIYYSDVYRIKEVSIPQIKTDNIEEVEENFKKLGLKVEKIYILGEETKPLYSIPYENTLVKVGSKVYLYCEMKNKKEIPNLFLLKKSQAFDILNDLNIKYQVIYVETNDYDEDVIIKQEMKDDVVLLHISKSKEHNILPNLVGLFDSEAISILKQYNINYVLNYEESIFPSGMVIFVDVNNYGLVSINNQSLLTLIIAK